MFVLDFGDQRVIDDATQRIHRGFTVFRGGQLVKASPRDRDLLMLLADYYAGEGMLISLEEPLWPNREQSLEGLLAERSEESVAELTAGSLEMLADLDDETQDLPTDVWGKDEADQVKALIGGSKERAVRTTWSPPVPLGDNLGGVPVDPIEDDETMEMPRRGQFLDGPPTLVELEDDATEVAVRPTRDARGTEDDTTK